LDFHLVGNHTHRTAYVCSLLFDEKRAQVAIAGRTGPSTSAG
jgi:hypothetical protein